MSGPDLAAFGPQVIINGDMPARIVYCDGQTMQVVVERTLELIDVPAALWAAIVRH